MKPRAIIQSELRAAADRVRAAGGRGAKTAIALAAAIGQALEDRAAVDLHGSAPQLCAEMGLDVCDRAAREALRLLAMHTRLVVASGRHDHGAVLLHRRG